MDILIEKFQDKIILVNNQRVMRDRELAQLYGVSVDYLQEQVRYHSQRFPENFMFQLPEQVIQNQILDQTLSDPAPTYVFSEQGAIMVALILDTPEAINTSVQLLRAFVDLRDIITSDNTLAKRVKKIAKKQAENTEVNNLLHFNAYSPKGLGKLELKAWLEEVTGKEWKPEKTIAYPEEIDLYNDELKTGVAFNLIYQHSDIVMGTRKAANFQYNKYLKCRDAGVRLIHVWDYQWQTRKQHVKNFLKPILGIYTHKIHARTTTFKPISKEDSREFMEDNHIQGAGPRCKDHFGLFSKDNLLVAVISFGKHPRNETDIVMTRLCIKDDYHVIGGVSKLFQNAIKTLNITTEVITWSDNDMSYGNVYEKIGFKKAEDLKPDYKYGDAQGQIFGKQSQRKKAVNCPEGLTEMEWAHQRGLFRFWNSGKIRWVYKKQLTY